MSKQKITFMDTAKRRARIVSRRVNVFVAVSVNVESPSATAAILHSQAAAAAAFSESWKTRVDDRDRRETTK
jgi:mevalonate pyrophosphate decarboxylase